MSELANSVQELLAALQNRASTAQLHGSEAPHPPPRSNAQPAGGPAHAEHHHHQQQLTRSPVAVREGPASGPGGNGLPRSPAAASAGLLSGHGGLAGALGRMAPRHSDYSSPGGRAGGLPLPGGQQAAAKSESASGGELGFEWHLHSTSPS